MIAIHTNRGRDAGCEIISHSVISATSDPGDRRPQPREQQHAEQINRTRKAAGANGASPIRGSIPVINQGTAGRQTQQQ